MGKSKRCGSCICFAESVGYCTYHDIDVTRYDGCKDHLSEQDYNDNKLEEQEEEE